MHKRFKKALPRVAHELLRAVGVLAGDMGHKAYLVGGIVRDLAMGYRNVDLDIAVEGDGPAVARALAAKIAVVFTGPTRFGTCKVESRAFGVVDFATTRKETYSRPGALPLVEPSGITEDLVRRDFTINAMAISLDPGDYGRLIDPFDGMGDLRRQCLRVLHDRSFIDDPTRILRGLRFAARYGFTFHRRTRRHLEQAVESGCLRSVSGKRVYSELRLICMEGDARRGLLMLPRYHVLEAISKNLAHDGGWADRLRRLSGAIDIVEDLAGTGFAARWKCWFGALFADIGVKRSQDLVTFFNPAADVREICKWVAGKIVRTRSALAVLDSKQAYRVTGILKRIPPEALIHVYAVCGRRERSLIRTYIAQWRCVKPCLTGGQIVRMGVGEGPLVGKILEQVLRLKLQGKLQNREQEIRYVSGRIARLRRTENRG
jgi:tRNA nucleotidyltransferase (CCA-adding enzyme)